MDAQAIVYLLVALFTVALSVLAICMLLRSSAGYSFVKGMLVAGIILFIIAKLISILGVNLQIKSIRDTLIYYDGKLHFINTYLWSSWLILLLYGLILSAGRATSEETNEKDYPERPLTRRNMILEVFLFFFTFGIYYYFWLYRIVKELKESFPGEITYSPGQAVGFLFIPLFNIYWGIKILFSVPAVIGRIEKKYYDEIIGFNLPYILIPILVLIIGIMSNLYTLFPREELDWSLLFYWQTIGVSLWLMLQAKLNALKECEQWKTRGTSTEYIAMDI